MTDATPSADPMAALAEKVDAVHARLDDVELLMREWSGQAMSTLAAVTALVSSHPRPEELMPALRSALSAVLSASDGAARFRGALTVCDALIAACSEYSQPSGLGTMTH